MTDSAKSSLPRSFAGGTSPGLGRRSSNAGLGGSGGGGGGGGLSGLPASSSSNIPSTTNTIATAPTGKTQLSTFADAAFHPADCKWNFLVLEDWTDGEMELEGECASVYGRNGQDRMERDGSGAS